MKSCQPQQASRRDEPPDDDPAAVAHDINNALAILFSAWTLARKPGMDEASIQELVQEAESARRRISELVVRLRACRGPERIPVNPNAVISTMVGALQRLVGPLVALRTELAPDTPVVRLPPGLLERLLVGVLMDTPTPASPTLPGQVVIQTKPGQSSEGKPQGFRLQVSIEHAGMSSVVALKRSVANLYREVMLSGGRMTEENRQTGFAVSAEWPA